MKQRMAIATTLCQMQLVIKITTMYLCTGIPRHAQSNCASIGIVGQVSLGSPEWCTMKCSTMFLIGKQTESMHL